MTATAEKLPPTLSQQIEEVRDQIKHMQSRLTDARVLENNYQRNLDKARFQADELSYIATSQPSASNTKKHKQARQEITDLMDSYQQAQDDTQRLPARIKASLRTVQLLDNQKKEAVRKLAVQKYSKQIDKAELQTKKSICNAVALRYVCNDSASTDMAVEKLFRDIVKEPEFRGQMQDEITRLMGNLNAGEI